MSTKALHALATLVVGFAFGTVWLRTFWRAVATPRVVLAAPLAVAVLGLGHWIAYDFSLAHWAGTFSFVQAAFNVSVAGVLLVRHRALHAPS